MNIISKLFFLWWGMGTFQSQSERIKGLGKNYSHVTVWRAETEAEKVALSYKPWGPNGMRINQKDYCFSKSEIYFLIKCWIKPEEHNP